MLERLTIRHLAVIEFAEIDFGPGLNILSGETGAGKSVILDAISLILGSRASADLIRFGFDEAIVEGEFDIASIKGIQARLQDAGLPLTADPDRSSLLIKRTVHRAGKHRITINGESATLGVLQNICEGLVDLCSQHEHQSLVRPPMQLELLDRYGALSERKSAVAAVYDQWRSAMDQEANLRQALVEGERKRDFLEYQIREINEAALDADEELELAARKLLLQSAQSRLQGARAALDTLVADDGGAIVATRTALQRLKGVAGLDAALTPVLEAIERAGIELEEASISIERYAAGIEMDPEQLDTITERLTLIADLKRKYGPSLRAVLDRLNELEGERQTLTQSDERLAELGRIIDARQSELTALCAILSEKRTRAAGLLSKSVTAELQELQMKDARFVVRVESTSVSATGSDAIQFEVQTNRGDQLRPLGKVASGGELSRLMLAVRRVIADRGAIGVYLFDEIDAGMGGKTAFQVGRKLRSVAQFNQVICITHLPQVAAFAEHHWVVDKSTRKDLTYTTVTPLSVKNRKEELARMLSGAEPTAKSLANAGELLELANGAHSG